MWYAKKYGGPELLWTTHSPTTVALTPEESIFLMKIRWKIESKKLQKDSALGELTSGNP